MSDNEPTNQPDPRIAQLMDLARDGDADAVADLWAEFGIRY